MRSFKLSIMSTCAIIAGFTSQALADSTPSAYQLQTTYTGEEWGNNGGLKSQSTYMQNFDARLFINTDMAFGWKGGAFVLEGFEAGKTSVTSRLTGAIYDASPIDTYGTQMTRLYQAYYKQQLGNTNILAGVYDLETEFAVLKPTQLFLDKGYMWAKTFDASGPTAGPATYPDTALAVRFREKIGNEWTVLAAVSDGVADSPTNPSANDLYFNKKYGALLIGEVNYVPLSSPRTKILAGYWGYTGKFDDLATTQSDGSVARQKYGSAGGYIGGATRLYDQGNGRGLDGFANFGWADKSVQDVQYSLSLGVTYTGLLNIRPEDKLGLAVGTAIVGDDYKNSQTVQGLGVKNYEDNFELTYRAKINDWLTVQPDVQYWINPGVDPTLKNDLLVGIHFEVSHLFNL